MTTTNLHDVGSAKAKAKAEKAGRCGLFSFAFIFVSSCAIFMPKANIAGICKKCRDTLSSKSICPNRQVVIQGNNNDNNNDMMFPVIEQRS